MGQKTECAGNAGGAQVPVGRLEEGALLFTLLGRIFHGVPDRALIAEVVDGRLFEEMPFVRGEAARRAQEALLKWTDCCADPFSDDDFREVSAEYTRLFVGARRVPAPMWESVYFNKDRMVFQHQTFEVRAMYARYGLEVDALSHEPDDHLAYELLFVARLFALAAEHWRSCCHDEAGAVLADLVSFVVCHPLTWVTQWRDSVHRHGGEGFYPAYADLVCAALAEVELALAPGVASMTAA